MNKETVSRVSIPGRIYDLIWNDEEFYREISQNKKASNTNKFPRYDQWCNEEGLHMAFALAGYAASDIKISLKDNELTVASYSEKESTEQEAETDENAEFSERKALTSVHWGMIVRGIARRSFKTKFVLHQMFDASQTKATMKNGLLEIVIPKRSVEIDHKIIEIKES